VADQRLRELERRWTETGADSDEAAYLRERVKTGELNEIRLRCAAALGSPGSRQAIGSSALEDADDPAGVVRALAGFYGPGVDSAERKELCERVAFAAASAAVGAVPAPSEETLARHRAAAPSQVISAAEGHALGCCPWHFAKLYIMSNNLGWMVRGEPTFSPQQVAAIHAAQDAARFAIHSPSVVDDEEGEEGRRELVAKVLEDAGAASSSSQVVRAVRDDLLPWLLGYRDPALDRQLENGEPGTGERLPF